MNSMIDRFPSWIPSMGFCIFIFVFILIFYLGYHIRYPKDINTTIMIAKKDSIILYGSFTIPINSYTSFVVGQEIKIKTKTFSIDKLTSYKGIVYDIKKTKKEAMYIVSFYPRDRFPHTITGNLSGNNTSQLSAYPGTIIYQETLMRRLKNAVYNLH